MNILAIDTSGKTASCAVLRNSTLTEYMERDAMLDHSSTLLELCAQSIEKAQLDISQIDIFAAAAGPGSFTGVRIGVAAVKGFGWTQSKPCAAVSTLFAMAFCAHGDGVVCCRIAARQSEYYYAVFERKDGYVQRLSDDAISGEMEMASVCARFGVTQYIDDAQNARGVALAALQMTREGRLSNCHEITPDYLRKPQAQRLLEEKAKTQVIKADI